MNAINILGTVFIIIIKITIKIILFTLSAALYVLPVWGRDSVNGLIDTVSEVPNTPNGIKEELDELKMEGFHTFRVDE